MEVITRVFETYDQAVEAVKELRSLGLGDNRLALLSKGHQNEGSASTVPVSDTENPGMGTAMGAAVGGAMGAAGGATLGLAAATLLIPGVGPVITLGLVGAALLGVTGAAVGAKVGDTLEEELGEGFSHEDVYLFEDALRHGKSVVVAYAEEGEQAAKAREALSRAGSLDLDTMRDNWWAEVRADELDHYRSLGRDFQSDEPSYRKGFQAALHPNRRGRSFADCKSELNDCFKPDDLNEAFENGYDRGATHHSKLSETNKV
ncbi:MAG TPA: hypothetical protein VI306_15490 [Pyrinomonadaceae bacterium]